MAKNKRNNSIYSTPAFKFLVLTTIAALFLLGIKNWALNYQESNVLGTSSYLARGAEEQESIKANETPKPTEQQEQVKPTDTPTQEMRTSQFSLENLKELRVSTEPNKTRVRLDSAGGRFELKTEDGKLKIKIKQEDGDEVEAEDDTLDDINEALEEEGISIASASGNKLRIRRGEFEAETYFPLSINPTTNTLTVTTPAGIKDVAVLPDKAVENLLRNKFIDRIASGSAEENPTGIKLGLLGNNPVFQVLGVDEQKLLGFIPVYVNKITFVSAENGQIVRVDETFLNRLLDFFSVQ